MSSRYSKNLAQIHLCIRPNRLPVVGLCAVIALMAGFGVLMNLALWQWLVFCVVAALLLLRQITKPAISQLSTDTLDGAWQLGIAKQGKVLLCDGYLLDARLLDVGIFGASIFGDGGRQAVWLKFYTPKPIGALSSRVSVLVAQNSVSDDDFRALARLALMGGYHA
ncbi:hypothetical protein B0181_09745 [Moraxella caviae]|uniref:Uncharacterized protein n=1 Tax=Moraxella caviae TaxID=34060 RepID=A0A1S9ZW81_9GAMM|nr:hypothetical protein [Moraxella caviae]OOR87728.1 hypothetical protein B0181_09745 [Moraxella caviae]STZ10141.1 Uncharacterised protein [Moraxella caviae]